MSLYLLSYDLRQPGRNYNELYTALRAVDSAKVLESVWLVNVDQTAENLRNTVLSHLDRNDGVLVIELTQDAWWAFGGVLPRGGAWLQRKLP